MFIQRAK